MDTPATPNTTTPPPQGHGARWLLIVIVLIVIGVAVYMFRGNIFNPEDLQGDVTGTFNSEPVVTTTSAPRIRTAESKTVFREDMDAILAGNRSSIDPTSSTVRHETFTNLLERMAEEF